MQMQLESFLNGGQVGHYHIFGQWRAYGRVHEFSGEGLLDLRADIARAQADPAVRSEYERLMLELDRLAVLAGSEGGTLVVTPD
jgi:hypothetical protein